MASIFRVRDSDGNIIDIPVLRGEKGDPYELTESDKNSIKNAVVSEILDNLPENSGSGLTEEQAADLAANTEARHEHDNLKTLAEFYCMASELENGDLTILPDVVGVDRVSFRGIDLRYCSDGGVVMSVEEIEREGTKYLRLRFHRGDLIVENNVPEFIDIPVALVTERIEEIPGPGLTTNSSGLELDFGINGSIEDSNPEQGVPVVNTVNDLPVDAEQDDIAFVKEAAFVETVEYQEEVPIVLQGGEQILNVEFKQDTKFIHETNIGEICPEVNNKENAIIYECGMATPNGECNISYVYYPSSLTSNVFGVEQSLDAYMLMQEGHDFATQYYKFRGISAKDFITNILELPGTEEQIQALLGEHYTDKSEDNPSYNWIKVIMSGEPLNDNSVFLEDAEAYFTLEYDATVDIKGLLLFDSYGFEVMKMFEDGDSESLFGISGSISSPDDNDGDCDFNEILKYGNAIANIFLSGGLQDISYDVFTQKGFHKFDEGWKSLEEEMNIPKVVDTYSDLPKSFIENGFMVVANEEKKLPEPTSEISAGAQGLVAIKPHFSVAEEMERIKQFAIENGAPEDLDWDSGDGGFEVGFYDPISDYGFHSYSGYVFNNDMKGIVIVRDINPEEDVLERWYYADEAGAEIELPRNRDTGSSDIFVTTEGGCWYYYEIEDGKDDTYLITSPKKYEGTEPFFISDKSYICEGIWAGFYSDDFEFDIEPNSYTFGFIDFYDSSKVENYPKGFYQYSNNRWYHQPDIAGASFDNEDVLKKITGEDIGNIDLNTEARHEHYNKSVLDQLPWDSYDKLVNQVPANTNARHTHNNQSYLDQIKYDTVSNVDQNTSARHTHSNKTFLDKITSDNYVHYHTNKTVLDNLTNGVINNSHYHSNSYYLDQISSTHLSNISSNTNARHTHNNKTVLDGISSTTINNITNNTSARHTHTNKTALDKVTQTHLDNSHTHKNQEILDSLNKELIDKSHSHENQEVLDKFLIEDNKLIVDGRKMRKSFEWVWVDKNAEKSYEITPQEDTLYDLPNNVSTLKIMLTKDGSYYRNNCILGEFWFHMALSEKFEKLRFEFHTNGEAICFTNNMPDGDTKGYLTLKIQRMFYGYAITWYSAENTFYGGNGTIYDEKIPINLQGTEYNYNYGRFTEDGFEFAPAYLDYNNVWYVNADDIYEEAGYQRVYGNIRPLRPLPENTHEEMKVHNINDLIVIERNYVPNEVCSGYYVNSGFIKDFFYYFAGYSQEELYLGLLNGIDLSNAEGVSFMFADCEAKSIPSLDLRLAKTTNGIFFVCDAEIIENLIIGQMDGKTFTELGMSTMRNLKKINIDGRIKVNSNLSLSMSDSLTIEAWVEIFEAFEDNSNEDTQYVCYINQTVLQELTPEQISIVTNKNILLA